MSNTQHTAGPWLVLPDPVWKDKHPLHRARFVATSAAVEIDGPGWRFTDPDAVIICTMPDSTDQQGNADLIAAAPDLLTALDLTLGALEAWMEIAEPHDMRQGDEHAASLARVAIRNARGLNRPKSP